jgi:hypothetical protein
MSVKVADFGMARATSHYVASSNAPVPIKWSAPEGNKSILNLMESTGRKGENGGKERREREREKGKGKIDKKRRGRRQSVPKQTTFSCTHTYYLQY